MNLGKVVVRFFFRRKWNIGAAFLFLLFCNYLYYTEFVCDPEVEPLRCLFLIILGWVCVPVMKLSLWGQETWGVPFGVFVVGQMVWCYFWMFVLIEWTMVYVRGIRKIFSHKSA